MTDIVDFYLASRADVALIETYEISHPSFSQVYRYVRNDALGGDFTIEDGSTHFFEFYPMEATRIPINDNLDTALSVSLGDVTEVVASEIDRLRLGADFLVRPTVTYRSYASDDYATILDGPFVLEVITSERRKGASQLSAQVRRMNELKTGERYTISRFPMLQGGF